MRRVREDHLHRTIVRCQRTAFKVQSDILLKQQGAVDPDLFLSRSDQLAEQRRTAKLKKERLLRSEEDHTIQRTQELLDYLRSGPDTLSFFDEALFSELVEKIIVTDNVTLRFRLINGLELTETIERTKR